MTTFNFGRGEVPAHRHINSPEYDWMNGGDSLGGWVADTATVSPSAFISSHAKVYGYAWVGECAQIQGHAQVYGYARVSGRALVQEFAKVYGDSQVLGNARIFGHARVCGDCIIQDHAQVFQNAKIYGQAEIAHNSRIFGNAEVYGNCNIQHYVQVYERAKICGRARLLDNVRVFGAARISGEANLLGSVHVSGSAFIESSPPQGFRRIDGTESTRRAEERRIQNEQEEAQRLREHSEQMLREMNQENDLREQMRRATSSWYYTPTASYPVINPQPQQTPPSPIAVGQDIHNRLNAALSEDITRSLEDEIRQRLQEYMGSFTTTTINRRTRGSR